MIPQGSHEEVLTRWARVDDFNPISSKQTLAYLKWKGYPIPKNRKTKKETGDSEALEKLVERHPEDPALVHIIAARKLQKGLGYFDDSSLGQDGRMHTQFTNLPDTGRLSSKKPNLQNIPAGKTGDKIDAQVADLIRSTVIPSPGMVLVELDWKAIEALLVGFFANDPSYVRISLMDPHSYLASFYVGKPADIGWPDDKLTAFLKEIKKAYPEEREICKRANHSDGYGIGIDHFAVVLHTDRKGAQAMKDLRAKAFPLVHKWKEETRLRAHYEGRLTTPFGYSRGFFEVLKKKANGEHTLGREANEALAFLPQSTAAAMMRETLLRVYAHPLHGKLFWLLLSIHDSILLECPTGTQGAVIKVVKSIMELPWPELNGLRVEADPKVGVNWGEMKTWKVN